MRATIFGTNHHPALPLLLCLALLPACMVGKGKYTEALEAKQECQAALGQCGERTRALESELKGIRQRVETETEANRGLMEELATLQAEEEENLRKVSMYQQQLKEREHQISRVTDTYKNLIQNLSQEIHEGKIRIDQSETRLKLNLVDKILFFLPAPLVGVLGYLGADFHFGNISKGILDSRDVIYFLSVIFVGLYATHLVMEEKS